MKTNEVFGISQTINPSSYIDRANLDTRFKRLINRNTHIALKGASKSGKSWLRQKALTNANVVQCRLGDTIESIYSTALGNLGISLESDYEEENLLKGTLDVSGEMGAKILAKISANGAFSIEHSTTTTKQNLWFRLDNLKFIAEAINASEKRLVIEDFHYLDIKQRQQLAFDLKTLWDYGCFVIIVGVWSQSNLLTSLNPDLTGRIEELSIYWTKEDLHKVINQGSTYLNIEIDPAIANDMIDDSYGNVGILQKLLLHFVEDECGIEETVQNQFYLANPENYRLAAEYYANQLNGLYQQLAKTLSRGIRKRPKSTGIYAITLQIIVDADDAKLISGLSRDDIYDIAHIREPRIKKGNLKTVLRKLEEIQIDENFRNIVLSYDESTDSIFTVDRQLLFYRKYLTVKWPWEEMIEEAIQCSLFDDESEQ